MMYQNYCSAPLKNKNKNKQQEFANIRSSPELECIYSVIVYHYLQQLLYLFSFCRWIPIEKLGFAQTKLFARQKEKKN